MGTVLFHLIHITNKMFTKPNYATLHSHYYIIFAKTRNKFYLSYMSLFKYVRIKPISRLNCLLASYDSKMMPNFFKNKHSIGENMIAHHYFRLWYNIATVSMLCKPQLYKSRRIFLYPDPIRLSYHRKYISFHSLLVSITTACTGPNCLNFSLLHCLLF